MTNSVNENQSTQSNLPMGMQDDEEISLLDLLQTIVDNLRLLVLGPLAVGIGALVFSLSITPTFTAKVQFLPPQQQSSAASLLSSLSSLGALSGAIGGIKNPADQYLSYLKSGTLQDSLIERFNLREGYEVKSKLDARLALTGNTRAILGKDGFISIEVDDKNPQLAADLANAYVEELGKLLSKFATTEAQQRRVFFEKQLTQAKDKLIQSEIALKATGVSGSVLKASPAAAVAAVAGLQATITSQEVKLGAMRGYLAETAPEFKQAMIELANLRAQLVKQEKDSPKVYDKATPEGDYISKYREYKYHETLFDLYSKQFELAKVDEARDGTLIQVLDAAEAPERKAKPKKGMIAIIATLVSGFVLLLFVTLRQVQNNINQDPKYAKKINQLKHSWRKALGRG